MYKCECTFLKFNRILIAFYKFYLNSADYSTIILIYDIIFKSILFSNKIITKQFFTASVCENKYGIKNYTDFEEKTLHNGLCYR